MSRKDNGEDTGFFVKNIESVQGDERDVIMFSIGYAKNASGKLVHNFGWLNKKGGENRLNVAISRAKQKVHIVTSFRPAELMLDDAKNDGPRILKRYLEYAFAISNGNKEEAEIILRSFGETYGIVAAPLETEFAQKVADALREKGYDIDTQVGIGGYRIDIAVRKNGKYVLGPNDLDLAMRLAKAGNDHRKFLRQIFVSVDITAPLYWWKEFDTYKVGTVANSCSTMHKIHHKKFERSDFSCEKMDEGVIALIDARPVLGSGMVLVPWSIVCFLQGEAPRGIGLLGIYAAACLLRSVLEPRFVGKQLGLDPLLTLAAIYIGYRLFGIGGMILAPLLAVFATQLLNVQSNTEQ